MHSAENLRDIRNLEMILGHPLDSRESKEPLLSPQEGQITGSVTYDLDTGKITFEDVIKPDP